MIAFLKAWWLKIAVVAAGAFVLIQFIPYGVDNPVGSGEPAWDSARTEELFDNACADCHSNDTTLLWFENLAPVKWYVANHVKEGREALNVSNRHTDPGRKVDEVLEVIAEREMPLASYTYLGVHSDAKLTAAERRELIEGLRATIAADPPRGGGEWRSAMTRSLPDHLAAERHHGGRAAWLRAAVLGANDGLISTAALMIGVADASSDRSNILIAGIAVLTAGALSMAAGEYVSVSSQRDTEQADLAKERAELEASPEAELHELASI